MREAARGVELLLSAFLLYYRCAKLDNDEPDTAVLEASVSSIL
jgi:DNA polymerase phi